MLLGASAMEEADLLRGALTGDVEARRAALFLAQHALSQGAELSPALQHWLAGALGALHAAVSSGGGGAEPLRAALAGLGHEPKRGRPGAPDNEQLDRWVQIVGAVQVLQARGGKSAAVQAVAQAVGLSESVVWDICKQLKRVKGCEGLANDVLDLVRLDCGRNPLGYSDEMREFLQVTQEP